MLMNMYFPKFDICHKFEQTQTLNILFFFLMSGLKFTLPDTTHRLNRTIYSGLKNYIQAWLKKDLSSLPF